MFSSKKKDSNKMAKTQAPSTDAVNQIKAGTNITGDIISNGTIRIDGTLKGTLNVEGKVFIGQTGLIEGNINCSNCDIEGSVSGKIQVKSLLSLKSTAKIKGEIFTSKLAIEPGAVYTGTCNMDGGNIRNKPSFEQEKKNK